MIPASQVQKQDPTCSLCGAPPPWAPVSELAPAGQGHSPSLSPELVVPLEDRAGAIP